MRKREAILRKLQESECRRLVRLHLPATTGELLHLSEVRPGCPRLLREFYAMTNGLDGDGVALWSVGGSLAVRDREDGAIPIGTLNRPCGQGVLYLAPGGEVECDTGETPLRWEDMAAFLKEVL